MTTVLSHSPYPVQGFEHRFYHGNRYHCVSAKVTLQWDAEGKLTPVRRQPDMIVNDVWREEQDRSSLVYASDLIPFKPTTDVVVTGTMLSPEERPLPYWYTALRIGKIEKRLKIFGPRAWRNHLIGGWKLSDPEPTDRVSLLYENAYGGTIDPHKEKYEEGEYYPPNPVGVGYIGKSRADYQREYPAAQIEGWDAGIKEFGRDVTPGGYGPVPGHVPDRLKYAGTYDERWKKEMAPHIPLDMDMRFWNAAPADQQTEAYLKAGEIIELAGMRSGPPIRLAIPNIDASTLLEFADRPRESQGIHLDTVALDLDQNRMTLRYHQIIPFDDALKRIFVTCALLPKQPGSSHG